MDHSLGNYSYCEAERSQLRSEKEWSVENGARLILKWLVPETDWWLSASIPACALKRGLIFSWSLTWNFRYQCLLTCADMTDQVWLDEKESHRRIQNLVPCRRQNLEPVPSGCNENVSRLGFSHLQSSARLRLLTKPCSCAPSSGLLPWRPTAQQTAQHSHWSNKTSHYSGLVFQVTQSTFGSGVSRSGQHPFMALYSTTANSKDLFVTMNILVSGYECGLNLVYRIQRDKVETAVTVCGYCLSG